MNYISWQYWIISDYHFSVKWLKTVAMYFFGGGWGEVVFLNKTLIVHSNFDSLSGHIHWMWKFNFVHAGHTNTLFYLFLLYI